MKKCVFVTGATNGTGLTIAKTFAKADFADGLVLRRGKKNYNKVVVE